MGWEARRNRSYYYGKEWKGGRSRSVYMGKESNPIAQAAAHLDTISRGRRSLARMDAEDEAARWATLAQSPPELLALEAAARQSVEEALLAAGYHQHKRQWRKKRHAKETA